MCIFCCRTLFEEYCSACETLGGNKSEIAKLNEKVKDLVQALEKRLVSLQGNYWNRKSILEQYYTGVHIYIANSTLGHLLSIMETLSLVLAGNILIIFVIITSIKGTPPVFVLIMEAPLCFSMVLFVLSISQIKSSIFILWFT